MKSIRQLGRGLSDTEEVYFSIYSMKMTTVEFCEVIKAIKKSYDIQMFHCKILTNSECNFGDMDGWKIESINFTSTGDESGWSKQPKLLENKNYIFNINLS